VAIANENHIIDANDTLLRMIGRTREQLLAGEINWLEMTPEKFRPLDVNAMEQLREFGACVPFEKEFFLPDGSSFPSPIGAVRLNLDLSMDAHKLVQDAVDMLDRIAPA
jgi:PAS domain-containing protein